MTIKPGTKVIVTGKSQADSYRLSLSKRAGQVLTVSKVSSVACGERNDYNAGYGCKRCDRRVMVSFEEAPELRGISLCPSRFELADVYKPRVVKSKTKSRLEDLIL